MEVMDFIIHHHKQFEDSRILSFAKLLGASFTAGEIRSWSKQSSGGEAKIYKNHENVVVPLSLVLKPELREQLKKMVGNTIQPAGDYVPKEGENVIHLGQVSTEDFKYWLRNRKLPEETLRNMQEQG